MIFAGWVIYFIDALFEGEFSNLLLWIAILCTPLGWAAFHWRYNLIVSAFKNGIEIPGFLTEVQAISTGKRRRDYVIDYEYQLHGKVYHYRNRVKTKQSARALKTGQHVLLLADEKRPQAAFIKELYLEPL
jgi:hypothetical protein